MCPREKEKLPLKWELEVEEIVKLGFDQPERERLHGQVQALELELVAKLRQPLTASVMEEVRDLVSQRHELVTRLLAQEPKAASLVIGRGVQLLRLLDDALRAGG